MMGPRTGAAMSQHPEPPKAYRAFVSRFPKLGQAWDLMAEAGTEKK